MSSVVGYKIYFDGKQFKNEDTYTIKDAEETVLSDDRKEMRKSFLNND